MRWSELLRGRTLTSPADIPDRYFGRLTLVRLGSDALGIRETETERALAWDAPALEAMGVSVVEIVPVDGSVPAFAGETAMPGTGISLRLEGRAIRAFDEYGLVLGDARSASLATAQVRAGHDLRAIALQQVRDASGTRTQLHVLVLPEGVTAAIQVQPTRYL